MAFQFSPFGNDQFFTSNGVLAVGAKLFTYLAGSTTKTPVYTDTGGITPHTNPIILNSIGMPPSPIFVDNTKLYKFVFTASTDTDPPSAPIYTADNVSIGTPISTLASYTKAGLPTAGIAGRLALVTDNIRNLWIDEAGAWHSVTGYINVSSFGAKGDGVTDDTAAFTAAGSSAATLEVHIYPGTYLLNSSPTPSGTVTWVLHAGATTTGAGALPGKIIKYGAVEGLFSILNKKTIAPASGEALGLKVGVGDGTEVGWLLNPDTASFVPFMAYISSSAVRNNNFGIFSLTNVSAGFPAQTWTFLGSSNNGHANAGDPRTATQNLGVEVESGGTFAPSAAFLTNGTTLANRWKHGIWFDYVGGQTGSTLIKANTNISVDYGIDLSLATINNQGVRIGTATAVVAPLGIKQFANAGIGIFLQRFTDTAPTGLLLQVTNAANSVVLASIDALGVITITSAVIGGAPAGQGPLGVKQLANAGVGIFLQRFTDTAPTGNILQVTNAANNAVLAAIDANGLIFTDQLSNIAGNLKLSPNAFDIQWNKALVALGGGAAPTLGTIGGAGPATATQNTWMQVADSAGVKFWVPVWK